MLKICDLIDNLKYIEEVAILEYNEWADDPNKNYEIRIKNKIEKMKKQLENREIYKLILLDDDILVGFISIFEKDSDELKYLTPWYSTMYVKKEYRDKGYSKILNNEIIKKAKSLNMKYLYLKTELKNYYEKFGAIYIKNINDKERLYKINIE